MANELTDEQVFGIQPQTPVAPIKPESEKPVAPAPKPAPKLELSDEQVFGKPKELTDKDVFGIPTNPIDQFVSASQKASEAEKIYKTNLDQYQKFSALPLTAEDEPERIRLYAGARNAERAYRDEIASLDKLRPAYNQEVGRIQQEEISSIQSLGQDPNFAPIIPQLLDLREQRAAQQNKIYETILDPDQRQDEFKRLQKEYADAFKKTIDGVNTQVSNRQTKLNELAEIVKQGDEAVENQRIAQSRAEISISTAPQLSAFVSPETIEEIQKQSARKLDEAVASLPPEQREQYKREARLIVDLAENRVKQGIVNNRLEVAPAILFDDQAIEKALGESEASDMQKKAFMDSLPALRKRVADVEIGPLSQSGEFQKFITENNLEDSSSVEKVQAFKNADRAWYDKLGTQARIGIVQGHQEMIGQIQATIGAGLYAYEKAGMATDPEGVHKLSQAFAAAAGDQLQKVEDLQVLSDAIGGPKIVAEITNTGYQMLPVLLPSFGVGLAAKGVGLTAQAASDIAFATTVGMSGLQSFGSTYNTATQAVKDRLIEESIKVAEKNLLNQGVAPDEARARAESQAMSEDKAQELAMRQAYVPAIISGLATATVTALGGKIGPEALLKPSVLSLAKNEGYRDVARAFLRDVGINAAGEFAEESVDQFIQGVTEILTYNPEKSMEDVIVESLYAGGMGAIFGAGGGAIEYAAEKVASRIAQKEIEKDPLLKLLLDAADAVSQAAERASSLTPQTASAVADLANQAAAKVAKESTAREAVATETATGVTTGTTVPETRTIADAIRDKDTFRYQGMRGAITEEDGEVVFREFGTQKKYIVPVAPEQKLSEIEELDWQRKGQTRKVTGEPTEPTGVTGEKTIEPTVVVDRPAVVERNPVVTNEEYNAAADDIQVPNALFEIEKSPILNFLADLFDTGDSRAVQTEKAEYKSGKRKGETYERETESPVTELPEYYRQATPEQLDQAKRLIDSALRLIDAMSVDEATKERLSEHFLLLDQDITNYEQNPEYQKYKQERGWQVSTIGETGEVPTTLTETEAADRELEQRVRAEAEALERQRALAEKAAMTPPEVPDVPTGSRIKAAAYVAPDGTIYTADSHLNAMQKAADDGKITQEEIASKQKTTSRETPWFGFATESDPFITRDQAETLAKASGQILVETPETGKLHSNEVALDDFNPNIDAPPYIARAIVNQDPISVEDVDRAGVELPKGWVVSGDVYVFAGTEEKEVKPVKRLGSFEQVFAYVQDYVDKNPEQEETLRNKVGLIVKKLNDRTVFDFPVNFQDAIIKGIQNRLLSAVNRGVDPKKINAETLVTSALSDAKKTYPTEYNKVMDSIEAERANGKKLENVLSGKINEADAELTTDQKKTLEQERRRTDSIERRLRERKMKERIISDFEQTLDDDERLAFDFVKAIERSNNDPQNKSKRRQAEEARAKLEDNVEDYGRLVSSVIERFALLAERVSGQELTPKAPKVKQTTNGKKVAAEQQEKQGVLAEVDAELAKTENLTENERDARNKTEDPNLNNVGSWIKTLAKNDPVRRLMDKILKVNPAVANVPIRYVASINGKYDGFYDPNNNRVVLPQKPTQDIKLLIAHEIVHAATLGKARLYDNRKFGQLTKDEINIFKELDKIRGMMIATMGKGNKTFSEIMAIADPADRAVVATQAVRDGKIGGELYALVNMAEFLANSINNTEFQKALDTIDPNIFRQIWNFIRALFYSNEQPSASVNALWDSIVAISRTTKIQGPETTFAPSFVLPKYGVDGATVLENKSDLNALVDLQVINKRISVDNAVKLKAAINILPDVAYEGVQVLFTDKLTPNQANALNMSMLEAIEDLGAAGTFEHIPYIYINTSKTKGDVARAFIHENAHFIIDQILDPETVGSAKKFYDSLLISRQAVYVANYPKGGDTRFAEWFAESMTDYYEGKLAEVGVSVPSEDLFSGIYKKVFDLFSDERAKVDAFFDGIEARLNGAKTEIARQAEDKIAPAAVSLRSNYENAAKNGDYTQAKLIEEDGISKILDVLTPDLLKKEYREANKTNETYGHCYAASEALYHMLGGKASGLVPMVGRDGNGVTHWWLRSKDGRTIDPTATQYTSIGLNPPYEAGKGAGFLTKEPSSRAQTIIDRVNAPQAIAPAAISPKDMTPEDYADRLAAMSQEDRDNVDTYENSRGYKLFLARELLKKVPVNSPKFKKITDTGMNFILLNEWDFVANVDGTPYGLIKEEDPDDEELRVWAFGKIGTNDFIETIYNVGFEAEVVKEMQKDLAKQPIAPAAVVPQQDRDYLDAVERGDLETAQRMVDEVARAAGYSTNRLYHGSAFEFDQFLKEKLGSITMVPSADEGFFFTTRRRTSEWFRDLAQERSWFQRHDARDKELAVKRAEQNIQWNQSQLERERARERPSEDLIKLYENGIEAEKANLAQAQRAFDAAPKVKPTIYEAYLLLKNPLVHDYKGKVKREKSYKELLTKAKEEGRDGVILRNTYDSGERDKIDAFLKGRLKETEDIYVVFEPNQIKRADPVTYDDQGNIIPLSQRFDVTRPEIAFAAVRIPPEEGGTLPPATSAKLEELGVRPDETTVVGTEKTYANILKTIIRKGISILDFGSGLGHGLKLLKDEAKRVGFEAFGYEPMWRPDRKAAAQAPDYIGFESLDLIPDNSQDYIINNAVLNVTTEDIRADIVKQMYNKLKVGGTLFLQARSWNNVKSLLKNNRNIIVGPREIFVPHKQTFQKGFTSQELINFVQSQLPDAKIVRTQFGDIGIAVTKPKVAPETSIKTLAGTTIKRYKNLVGKQVGEQIYVHKNYASEVIPADLLDKAPSNFTYNTVMYNTKTGAIRFDEAPDFDTAREPRVGNYVTINPDGTQTTGKSESIWHHKWLWVKDDYAGFDVAQSKNWSRQWLSKVPEVAKGTVRSFEDQLKKYNVTEQAIAPAAVVPKISKVNDEYDGSRIGTATQGKIKETTQDTNVTIETVDDTELVKQMAGLNEFIEGVELPKSITSIKDPKKKRDAFINFVVDNLLALYDAFPVELRAAATRWYDGARKLAEGISRDSGLTPEQAAGVLASFSPMKDWFQNVELGIQFGKIFKNHLKTKVTKAKYAQGYKDVIASASGQTKAEREAAKVARAELLDKIEGRSIDGLWQEASRNEARALKIKQTKKLNNEDYLALPEMAKAAQLRELAAWAVRVIGTQEYGLEYNVYSPDGDVVRVQTKKDGKPRKLVWQSANFIEKALSIAYDGSLKNISDNLGTEHKIRSFYNNIIAPNSPYGDTTVDTHAVNAGVLFPMGNKGKLVGDAFGDAGVAGGGNSGIYWLFHEAYRIAAARAKIIDPATGKVIGTGIQPRQMQSITWEAVRGLFPDGDKRKKSFVEEFKNIWKNAPNVQSARKKIVSRGINLPDWASAYTRDGASTVEQEARVGGTSKSKANIARGLRNRVRSGDYGIAPAAIDPNSTPDPDSADNTSNNAAIIAANRADAKIAQESVVGHSIMADEIPEELREELEATYKNGMTLEEFLNSDAISINESYYPYAIAVWLDLNGGLMPTVKIKDKKIEKLKQGTSEAETVRMLNRAFSIYDGASEGIDGKEITYKVGDIVSTWLRSGLGEAALRNAIIQFTNLDVPASIAIAEDTVKQYGIQQRITDSKDRARVRMDRAIPAITSRQEAEKERMIRLEQAAGTIDSIAEAIKLAYDVNVNKARVDRATEKKQIQEQLRQAKRILKEVVPRQYLGDQLTALERASGIDGLKKIVGVAQDALNKARLDYAVTQARKFFDRAAKAVKAGTLTPAAEAIMRGFVDQYTKSGMSDQTKAEIQAVLDELAKDPINALTRLTTTKSGKQVYAIDKYIRRKGGLTAIKIDSSLGLDALREITALVNAAIHMDKMAKGELIFNKKMKRDEWKQAIMGEIANVKTITKEAEGFGPKLGKLKYSTIFKGARVENILRGLGLESMRKFVYENLVVDAQNDELRNRRNLKKTIEAATKQITGLEIGTKDYDKYSKQLFDITGLDQNGNRTIVKVRRSELIDMVASLRDSNNFKKAVRSGGYVIDRLRGSAKGDTIEITPQSYVQIQNSMTQSDLDMVDFIVGLYNNELFTLLNDASIQSYGHGIKKTDGIYYPRNAFKWDRVTETSADLEYMQYWNSRVDSVGHLKERTDEVNARLVAVDFLSRLDYHVTNDSRISAYLPVVQDINSIIKDPDVMRPLELKVGEQIVTQIGEMVRQQTIPLPGLRDGLLKTLIGNAGIGILGFKIHASLQNPVGIPIAMGYYGKDGLKYAAKALGFLRKGFNRSEYAKMADVLNRYAPYFAERYGDGGFIQEFTSGMVSGSYDTKWRKNIEDKSLSWLEMTDKMGALARYKTAVEIIKDRTNLKEGTEDFDRAVSREWSLMMFRSENTSHGADRTGFFLEAAKNPIFKIFMMFQSAVSKQYSLFAEAVIQAQQGGRENLQDAAMKMGFVAASVYMSLAISSAFYGILFPPDEEDEKTLTDVMASLLSAPMAIIPVFGNTIQTGVAGFISPENIRKPMQLDIMSGFIFGTIDAFDLGFKAIRQIGGGEIDTKTGDPKWWNTSFRALEKGLNLLGQAIGVPIGGLMQSTKFVYRLSERTWDGINGDLPSDEEFQKKLAKVKREMAPEPTTQEYAKMYFAVTENNQNKFNRALRDLREKNPNASRDTMLAAIQRRPEFIIVSMVDRGDIKIGEHGVTRDEYLSKKALRRSMEQMAIDMWRESKD